MVVNQVNSKCGLRVEYVGNTVQYVATRHDNKQQQTVTTNHSNVVRLEYQLVLLLRYPQLL